MIVPGVEVSIHDGPLAGSTGRVVLVGEHRRELAVRLSGGRIEVVRMLDVAVLRRATWWAP